MTYSTAFAQPLSSLTSDNCYQLLTDQPFVCLYELCGGPSSNNSQALHSLTYIVDNDNYIMI
jgi:hypothetical protein